MSIFSENIQSELPLETVFGIRFHKALDDALINWRGFMYRHQAISFERVVNQEICNQFGMVFINRKRYELINSKVNIHYSEGDIETNEPIKANVSFLVFFKDHTGHGEEYKQFLFKDIVTLKY